jgi:hypothetical protein
VTILYVIVTFFSSMLTAALLSRMGMEKQVKLVSNFNATCCSEKPLKAEPLNLGACCAGTLGIPKITPTGSCCSAN